MNTTHKATAENGNILIGEAKPLDIEKLLDLYGAAASARQKDGSVLIDAVTLQRMAKELILVKSGHGTPIISRSNIRQGNPGHVILSDIFPEPFNNHL